ncbi:hypothetical protein [Streptomyces sp. ISL-11]|uniref:hypothetical protein n=1 Tax=Streptomyces sp. ISL-11 TaxID=2819174 RepID=UPI001BE53929|nr:hypothetical protein [Streptomyces sp. ISL-11]MBT2387358.1 hypothetical protein [Streptomyces sp. ISL-11]
MGLMRVRADWPTWAGRAALGWSVVYAAGALAAALSPGYAFGYSLGGAGRGTAVEWALAGAYAGAAAAAYGMARWPGARGAHLAAWAVAALAFASGFGFLFSPAHLLDVFSRNQTPMNWAAWANEGVATLGAALWAATALAHRRHACGVCAHCGGRARRGPVARRTRAGRVAVAALLPYATLKTAWALGATVGYTGDNERAGLDEYYANDRAIWLYDHGVDITAVLAVVGMVLALALTRPWGRRMPRWPLLALGWTGAGALAPFGIYMAVWGVLVGAGVVDSGIGGHAAWVVVVAYGGFSFYGLALGRAAGVYRLATRRACGRC